MPLGASRYQTPNHSHSIIHSPLHASVHWGGSDFEVLYTVKDTVKTRGLR